MWDGYGCVRLSVPGLEFCNIYCAVNDVMSFGYFECENGILPSLKTLFFILDILCR